MQPTRIARTGALLTALVLAGGGAAQAQTGYLRPPDPIPAIVTAEPTPTVLVGRDRQTLALLTREALPSIEQMAEPELRLAGFRISPRTNGISGTRASYSSGLAFQDLESGRQRAVQLPAGARIANVAVVAGRAAAGVRQRTPHRAGAVGGGGRHRPGAPRDGRGAERDPGHAVPLAAGQLRLRRGARGPGTRPGAAPVGGAVGAHHPGEPGPHGARAHLPGPAAERGRRGAVRALLHRPAFARAAGRRASGGPGRAGDLLRLRPLAGRPLSAGDAGEASRTATWCPRTTFRRRSAWSTRVPAPA